MKILTASDSFEGHLFVPDSPQDRLSFVHSRVPPNSPIHSYRNGELDLKEGGVSSQDLQKLLLNDALVIHSIDVAYNPFVDTKDIVNLLNVLSFRKAPGVITYLNLSGHQMSKGLLSTLLRLMQKGKVLGQVSTLILNDMEISTRQLMDLTAHTWLPSIRALSLAGNPLGVKTPESDDFSSCLNLLERFNFWKNLQVLNLSHCKLTGPQLFMLLSKDWLNLSMLNLSHNLESQRGDVISTHGILAGLSHGFYPNLHWLNLEETFLTDQHLHSLTDRHLQQWVLSLREIKLAGNQDVSIPHWQRIERIIRDYTTQVLGELREETMPIFYPIFSVQSKRANKEDQIRMGYTYEKI